MRVPKQQFSLNSIRLVPMRAQNVQVVVRFTGPHISSAAKGALRAAWKRAALKQSRPLFLRAPYASLNRMALLRANPENKFGYPERVFYMRLPCPHCPRKDSNIVINL